MLFETWIVCGKKVKVAVGATKTNWRGKIPKREWDELIKKDLERQFIKFFGKCPKPGETYRLTPAKKNARSR